MTAIIITILTLLSALCFMAESDDITTLLWVKATAIVCAYCAYKTAKKWHATSEKFRRFVERYSYDNDD